MRHEPIDDTPPLLPTTTPTPPSTRTSGPKWSNTRVKIHTNPLKTAQSHRFYTPFALPNHLTPSPETARIKRRLFSVTSTPRKKKTTELSTPHVFRIVGGQECTQPLLSTTSSANKAPVRNGVLTGQIAKAERNAALNARVLRRLLNTSDLDVVELQRVAEKGLVLRVMKRGDGVLVVESVRGIGEREQFLVVVPTGFDENARQEPTPVLLFVPEPWSPVGIDQTATSSFGLLIIPFRLEILTEKNVKTILDHCRVNEELRPWLKIREEYGSQYRVPETQDSVENGHHDGKEIGPCEVTMVKTLSEISPHSMRVSIQVDIDVYSKELGIAIVHDEVGERAVYLCSDNHTLETFVPQQLTNIRICPQRIPTETIVSLFVIDSSYHPKDIHELSRASSLPIIAKNEQ